MVDVGRHKSGPSAGITNSGNLLLILIIYKCGSIYTPIYTPKRYKK